MSGYTTLMIRHVPRKFTAWDVVAELQIYIRMEEFDFVYVPGVANANVNMGYAFVNIPDPHLAHTMCQCMAGMPWATSVGSDRRMRVQPAFVQGLKMNLERFIQNISHRLDSALQHVPLVFRSGVQVPLERAIAFRCHVPVDEVADGSLQPTGFQARVLKGTDIFETQSEPFEYEFVDSCGVQVCTPPAQNSTILTTISFDGDAPKVQMRPSHMQPMEFLRDGPSVYDLFE